MTRPEFADVSAMLRAMRPVRPVYCIYPDAYVEPARRFVAGFPGRVLYAVKANDDPDVLDLLWQGGVRAFDCASLEEVERVAAVHAEATCYFMVPVRLRGAAAAAQNRFGVRHFMLDHPDGLAPLAAEIDLRSAVVFARMAVTHPAAMQELSSKFGAPPERIPALLGAIAAAGAEPALAFNVGTAVTSPDAYRHAIEVAAGALANGTPPVRVVDVGGGFPQSYPGFSVPPLEDFFAAIAEAGAALPLASGAELLAEPGRALAAPGLSAVVEVLHRDGDRLYLNDGMYGIFWELRFKGHDRYPVRCYRDAETLDGGVGAFTLFGPTCDSTDKLPGRVELPAEIRPGDYLEFGHIGAYSLTGRTNFNGHYSDQIVTLNGPDARPPRS